MGDDLSQRDWLGTTERVVDSSLVATAVAAGRDPEHARIHPRTCVISPLRTKTVLHDAAGVDMHANQLTLSVDTVRELVDHQFPECRGLPIEPVVSQGTVNAILRIGGVAAMRPRSCRQVTNAVARR